MSRQKAREIKMSLLNPSSALQILSSIVATQGPIATVRVSSAQARGAAKRYAYWGAARGEIRARKADGALTCLSIERASSDRRAKHLAADDADRIAELEDRIHYGKIGQLDENNAVQVLRAMGIR
jgi:mRNA-degrading endonuclease toxin of MazEF toxin-antitoxin module